MVPKKLTSYRGQGESGFPEKTSKKFFLDFFREIAIASNNKQMWIEIEGYVYLATDVPLGRRPGTNACLTYMKLD